MDEDRLSELHMDQSCQGGLWARGQAQHDKLQQVGICKGSKRKFNGDKCNSFALLKKESLAAW